MSPKSYREAGVDISAAERLVERIKPLAQRTAREGVLGGLGGFGGHFALPKGYSQPVLVSGSDGVGTKLLLAQAMGHHRGLGVDLVAMCVNDILASGAEPLFFLDYIATGKLQPELVLEILEGISAGCLEAGAALLGGETAQMPGCYPPGHFDLAGFAVGVVEKDRLLDGARVRASDRVLGIESLGLHSNGFSLVRKLIDQAALDLHAPLKGVCEEPLGELLLRPTPIYVAAILKLLKKVEVHALAHITGGGLPGNLPRVLPENSQALLDPTRWRRPEIFRWILEQGLSEEEAYRSFNMGLGFCVILPADACDEACALLQEEGHSARVVGEICEARGRARLSFGALQSADP